MGRVEEGFLLVEEGGYEAQVELEAEGEYEVGWVEGDGNVLVGEGWR